MGCEIHHREELTRLNLSSYTSFPLIITFLSHRLHSPSNCHHRQFTELETPDTLWGRTSRHREELISLKGRRPLVRSITEVIRGRSHKVFTFRLQGTDADGGADEGMAARRWPRASPPE